ncbi:integrase catalytic domain-containing protein [Phytoactinopolyspora endophytica]|uniref:integrase catalytic domain-containing protein n=1 Tax=Phytoactinopolyspora endophytica TaxID=1642495 RepID=UPI00101C84F5|nr:DDE-type integrase/transposase/recombinase [Phytoactinopolyspora endophytica]
MELTLAPRRQITQAQLARWPKATKSEKSAILDAVCAVTGWHRDHARKAIRRALADRAGDGPRPRKERVPVRVYGPDAVELLTRCWAVLDGPTGKRLRPALPEVLANLGRHGHLDGVDPAVIAQVLAKSPATIDRRLAGARVGLVAGKTIAHTRPGSMLKASIPMKTWREWNEAEPGFVQIDLVGHEGGDNNGEFCFTLDATDVATGWTEAITVRSKGERIVAAVLEELWLRFPFHIAGIHSDNGSEFINHHLARWCQTRQITFTRGRASNKNDQAHVEQKNWSVVRRSVGYFRYDTRRELALLNQLWQPTSLQVNLFLPQQKLISKTRTGAIVRKQHDTATTPMRRLFDQHDDLVDQHDRTRLETLLQATDLIALRHEITDIQANLIELARRRGTIQPKAKTTAVYLSRRKLTPPQRAKPDESTNHHTRAS